MLSKENTKEQVTDNQMDYVNAGSARVDYENILSSEELQCGRSQESPRVTRSSSIGSSSTLTDDEEMFSCISITSDEIVKKATFFVETFVGELEEKLSQFSKEAKPGSKIRKTGRIVDQIDSTIKSTVSPGMRLIPDKINECIGFVYSKEHRKKAKRISAIISGLSKDEIRKASVEASLEIFQKFEKQLTGIVDADSSSWKRGVEKLAIDAASRAINYILASNEKGELSVSCITKGVVLGKSKSDTLAKQYLCKPAKSLDSEVFQPGFRVQDKQSGEILLTSALYENVGIKKIEGNATKYYQLNEHEKYGYRLPFVWELEEWKEVEQKYVLVNSPKKEEYEYILDEEKKKKLANSILKEINGNDLTKKKRYRRLV